MCTAAGTSPGAGGFSAKPHLAGGALPGKGPHMPSGTDHRRHHRHHHLLALTSPVALAAVLAAPAAGAAEKAPVFGKTGQIVLPEIIGVRTGSPAQFMGIGLGGYPAPQSAGEIGLAGIAGYGQSQTHSTVGVFGENGQSTATLTTGSETFWVAPSADVFVGRGFSIGLSAGLLRSWETQEIPGFHASAYERIAVSVSPRVGYVVPIGRGLSFWPRVSVGLGYSQYASASANTTYPRLDATGHSLSGSLDLGLVYQPVQRLMFKLAPQIGAGRASVDSYGDYPGASQGFWVRVGAEATAGLVF